VNPRIVIFIPGIDQWPNDSKLWDGRAATWFNVNAGNVDTDRMDYWCGPITRAFHQQQRIDRAKDVISTYAGKWDITIACHSNGDDITLNALDQLNWPRVEVLHLISGACQADFDKNGLNQALADGKIGKVIVYVAGKDRALAVASTFLGRWLGYGTLGLKGPMNVRDNVASLVQTITKPDYGHSDWFTDENFEATMRGIL